MWSSSDGRSWTALDAAALGGSTIVVGMAATPDGLVALTFASGQVPAGQDAGEMLKVAAPLRSWSSPDGVTWTDHPGPDVALPAEGYLNPDDIEWLQASTAPRLIVAAGSRPPFSSTDGVTWTRATTSGPPSGFSPSSIKAVGSGFVAVADNAIASSPDGGTWTKHALPTGCSANQEAACVIGPAGSVATGLHRGQCQRGAAVGLVQIVRRPGVAQAPEPDAARPDVRHAAAQGCRGQNCPDGTLVGDGERIVAYRGWVDQVGWTSFDGRTWQPLAFTGRPEKSAGWLDDSCTQSLVLMPMGMRCLAGNPRYWFGEPSS